MSLGVFGGTFNPIHLAHLRVAEAAREALDLERVLFIPSADPPHKSRRLASAPHRLELVKLASASNPSLEIDPSPPARYGTRSMARWRPSGTCRCWGLVPRYWSLPSPP